MSLEKLKEDIEALRDLEVFVSTDKGFEVGDLTPGAIITVPPVSPARDIFQLLRSHGKRRP